jgi:glycosyltransferase involved in cell wall biosynthesis
MRILWVKSGGLLPLDTGGKIRSFNIARELARRHEVDLFTFYPRMTPDPHVGLGAPFGSVECMPLDLAETGSARELLSYAANSLTSRPYQMRKYCRPEVGRRLRALTERSDHDVVLCDFLLTAKVLAWTPAVPTVVFTHNVEAAIWRRSLRVYTNPLWKLVAWREYKTMARAERYFAGLADHVLTVSDDDRRAFVRFVSEERVTTVPTGVDLDYFVPAAPPERTAHGLVFTGSMDWMPNEDAVLYFASRILGRIRERVPDVTFSVVGRRPGRRVLRLMEQDPAIRVTGGVEDVRPYLSEASVFVVPLRIGSGTRIKIFEAMAMGMPVVSTSVGAEGLAVEDGAHILLADTPEEFAERTVSLLTRPRWADRIGRAARALVESGRGWSAAVDVVEKVLCSVVAREHDAAGRTAPCPVAECAGTVAGT